MMTFMTPAVKLDNVTIVGRSNTGIYHKMLGNSIARCNARSGIKLNIANVVHFERAAEKSFCKKCFPQGKPTDYVVGNIEVQR